MSSVIHGHLLTLFILSYCVILNMLFTFSLLFWYFNLYILILNHCVCQCSSIKKLTYLLTYLHVKSHLFLLSLRRSETLYDAAARDHVLFHDP